MNVSFGKFIPVKVFINGNEIKNNSTSFVPKEIERVTLSLCDCLSRDEHYPNSYLAEQQRRFFASQVEDYKYPIKPSQNKTDILPSSVKTVNIDGKRYLVTGDDIYVCKDKGHELGVKKRNIIASAEDRIGTRMEGKPKDEFERCVDSQANVEICLAKQDRINSIKQYMIKEKRNLDKTLYIYAIANPDAKLQRDKYRIALIDFKA